MDKKISQIEVFERIRQLSLRTRTELFYLIKAWDSCNYNFDEDIYDTFNFFINRNTAGHYFENTYVSPMENGSLGKLRREGLVDDYEIVPTDFGEKQLYHLSPLLRDFDMDSYHFYVKNYNFFKDNILIIKRFFEEKIIEVKNNESHWISNFKESYKKIRFKERKERQLKAKQDFTVHDVVCFNARGQNFYGAIMKMNPMRAEIEVNAGSRWICSYGALSHKLKEKQPA